MRKKTTPKPRAWKIQRPDDISSWLEKNLFHLTPSAVAVIDNDWRVVRANKSFENRFGEWRGRRCYEVYKGAKRRCPSCSAARSFRDGRSRSRHEIGVDSHGHIVHYLVHVIPFRQRDGSFPYIVEISTDITRQALLEGSLAEANALQRALVEASGSAILAFDNQWRVRLANPAASKLFGWQTGQVIGSKAPAGVVPEQFMTALQRGEDTFEAGEMLVSASDGQQIPVKFLGRRIQINGKFLGAAAFYHDLREIKQMEKEKLDSERLAAVGQTVAGLAHGVKNILTGLEGGLYLMQTGLQRNDSSRVQNGFAMLNRNIGRVTAFVRTLLDFSKGQKPAVKLINPMSLLEEVVYLYRDAARKEGIDLAVEPGGHVGLAAFDPEGLHTCLSNLVTNALDACRMSDNPEKIVRVRALEIDDPLQKAKGQGGTAVCIEVEDNGVGLDYEVKQKVFTNFFTTKGEGGTGLGLLVTRKIVQEHGGSLEVESEPGRGTVFRMVFPRRRLPPVQQPHEKTAKEVP